MLSRMPRLLRTTLLSVRDLIAVTGPFVLIALLLLAGAYYLLDPTPPKRVVLATGPEQSDYAEFGKRYAAELKRYGIDVVLRPTLGSSQNRRLLRDAAQSLNREATLTQLSDLRGWRVNVGARGSGVT